MSGTDVSLRGSDQSDRLKILKFRFYLLRARDFCRFVLGRRQGRDQIGHGVLTIELLQQSQLKVG